MALSTAERTNIIKLVVGMFNAAPGATYLADLTVAFEANGRSLSNLAKDLALTPAYKALNPVFQTAAEFATAFLTPLGLQANTVAIDFVTAKFNAGVSKGQIAYEALVALDASTATEFADAKAIVNNKTTVATYYSVTKAVSVTNVGQLQASISTVTKDAASVTAAQGTIDSTAGQGAGNTVALTSAVDIITGTSGNDVFNAAIGSGGTTATTGTYTAADSVDGAAGTGDTLNLVTLDAVALPAASTKAVEILNVRAVGGALTAGDLSTVSGLTTYNVDRSTAAQTVTNLAAAGQFGLLGDNSTLFGNVTFALGYASSATTATLNFQNGVKAATGATAVTVTGAGVTATVINSTGANNSISTAAAAGVITNAATSKATTINATTNLTAALTTTADTKLTVTGTGVVDLSGVAFGSALNNAIVTIDASAQTAGGLKVQAGNSTTIKFTGGAGADSLGLGAVVATGATVDGGGGTDTLYVAGNSAFITAGTGAIIKNFEAVDVTTATIDLDNLATNNTLTALRVGGSATVSNINAATAGAVTVYANATPVLNVKGATTPGQLDTVKIDVNDGSATVNTITVTAPTLTAVETLNVTATDNVTITSLANALALTGITFTGAGNVSLTTTAIALNPNVTVDASAATGNFTLDATGATANGYTIKGSAGTNILTGGSAPIVVDITKSVAKADQVIVTSAAGSTASVLQSISGFTNAVTTGDKLDVINTGTITANAAAAATGVTNLLGAIASGIITFSGTAAATATLDNKITAAATLAGTTQYNMVAFEHGGNTYVYEQGDTGATYAAGTDLIVQLTGVTGVTALSTTASGATTIFVV